MKRKGRIVLIVFGLLVVLIVALPFLINVDRFRPRLESELSTSLGREVTVGHLGLSIFSGTVTADKLSLADDPAFSRSPFVEAQSCRISIEWMPLIFSRTLRVTALKLDKPEITLLENGAGKWNFSNLGASPKTKPAGGSSPPGGSISLTVGKLEISDGRITFGNIHTKTKPQVYDQVNIAGQNLSLTSEFPFTLSARLPGEGTLSLKGKAGPINQLDAAETPFNSTLQIRRFNLSAAQMTNPASALSGLVDFEGTFTSDGAHAHATGKAKADKLQLVKGGAPASQFVELEYATDYDLKKQTGVLHKGNVRIGKALANLSGSYDLHAAEALLNMQFIGKALPVNDVESLLPALGIMLPAGSSLKGGTLSLDFGIHGPLDKMVITGTSKLEASQLAGFDLGSKMALLSTLAGIQRRPDTSIENLSSDLRIAPEGIQASNISLIVPAIGNLAGNGTINPAQALDFKMTARLPRTSVIGEAGHLTGLTQKGDLVLPFFIRGTAAKPEFIPDAKGMASEAVKSVINPDALRTLGDLFKKKKNP
jgi:AsmA protein